MGLLSRKHTRQVVAEFDPGDDFAAAKSKDLVWMLLKHGSKPFSASQFWPGHITCTALVFHPHDDRVLTIYHHRLCRWLLPGGHVERTDASLAAAAEREAREETCVEIDRAHAPFLAGIDVHGIPPKLHEPYHLHHDLIWCFRAAGEHCETTSEAPELKWAAENEWNDLSLTSSIRNSIRRAILQIR